MRKTFLAFWFPIVAAMALGACAPSTVGLACTSDRDCDPGQSCFVNGFPGGFCTKGCLREGSLSECPKGTVCARTTAPGSSTFVCAVTCTDTSGCRGDPYVCASVTGATEKACVP